MKARNILVIALAVVIVAAIAGVITAKNMSVNSSHEGAEIKVPEVMLNAEWEEVEVGDEVGLYTLYSRAGWLDANYKPESFEAAVLKDPRNGSMDGSPIISRGMKIWVPIAPAKGD